MSKNDEARARYLQEYEQFHRAADAMAERLQALVASLGVRGHVEVRAKAVGSFVKKIHSNNYKEPWREITDKLGGRVIVKTLDDMARLRQAFEQAPPFQVLWLEDKSEKAKPEQLYYPGVHVQVVVPEVTTTDGEPIECEIQLRTKAQDLWSVASHDLVYKGVIEPEQPTKRRVVRLSVLTEMFDEEVKRAMREIASDPRYEVATLLRAAESLYLTFVAEEGEDELSIDVLRVVLAAIPEGERESYPETLARFVSDHRAKLADLFATYGAYSEFVTQYAYWLFSQPEALVVLERIQTRPQLLAEAVSGTEIQDPVRHLFAAWGASMPSVV